MAERWTCDRQVAGSTPDRGAIKSTRSTQPIDHESDAEPLCHQDKCV